jgi:hypothetical protein
MKTLISALLLFSFAAHADLASTFKAINNTYKGPFSLNYIQGTAGRVPVRESEVAPGEFQFQSAFRNDMAKELATKNDFYLGNLFTTNYYELTGTYVYNNTYGSFPLNQQALLAAAPQASAQAASMVRHWVLEKHYVTFFPNNKLSQAYTLRGISGAEFEQQYAFYFFNFYMSAITEDYQFLPAFLLAKSSPIADSASLEKARTLIAKIYDEAKLRFGDQDPGIQKMYQLRNAIHNQLSPEVITQIDKFIANYPAVGRTYGSQLSQIQDILRTYYRVGPKRISDLARVAGVKEVQAAADALNANGFSADRALALSFAVTTLRTNIATAAIPYEKKTDALILMFSAAQYLNKEISNMSAVKSKDAIKAVVNLLYVEGFLIKDNWDYFTSEIDGAPDVASAAALIPDVADIANDTLNQAFNPALAQWISLEPKMQYFIDNTIKSSALNTASIISKKVQ